MDFKKWLKKNKIRVKGDLLKFPTSYGFVSFYGRKYVIPVRALGEWAWERLMKRFKFIRSYDLNVRKMEAEVAFKQELPELLTEIAIACLGEKEVKKRLEGD